MADPGALLENIGGGLAAGGTAIGIVVAWCKRLDLKKQDTSICAERNKDSERRFAEGNERFKESEARDKVMSNDIFDIKLAVNDMQKDIKQLLKSNGGNR